MTNLEFNIALDNFFQKGKELELKINEIIKSFEVENETTVMLSIVDKEVKVGLIVDVDAFELKLNK